MTAADVVEAGTLWVTLDQADDPAVVGGKAAQLGRLRRAGLPVPDGGVVTISAQRGLRDGGLDPDVFLATVHSRLSGYRPDEIFAVRSSAEVEDSARASFAGQFQSLLGVRRDDVPAAVAAVHESVYNPSAGAYARRMGVPTPDALAVIVQVQVRARLAGVCFTVDPVTGADDVLVEYALGTGDAVVGGHALPDGVQRFRRGPAGPVAIAPDAGAGSARGAAVDPYQDETTQVARLAVALEEMLGAAQDVEWAFDADRLWLLQARPITTGPNRRNPPGPPVTEEDT